MKNHRKYLHKLYALLLLAAISFSVLPVKLIHGHEGEHVLLSRDFAKSAHFAPGHQAFCPVCSCIFTQHYLPAETWESVVYSFPWFHTAPFQQVYLPETLLSVSLRGPPAC
ncbi:hypothetical protein [Anseongella ginsenosidimutans]|uniref:hypothetical protein n=1 Tax=Anseongella ginsenosidimutans TaxID=496056 RepID=UPI001046943D|nr:hypothetical protein [Anseongella ginsenosidimutans]QEC51779.1 hypothetical protein FRZ59_05115 [Anseongella ginsenosidimutans]